jgi:Fungal specific transcription factor domain
MMDTGVLKPAFKLIPTTALIRGSQRNPDTTFEFLINFTAASGFASTFDNDLSFHRCQEPHEISYSDAETSTLEFIDEFWTPQVSIDWSQLSTHEYESPQTCSTHIFGYPVHVDGFEVRHKTMSCLTQPIEPTFTELWLSSQQYYRPSALTVDATKRQVHELQWNSDSLTLKAIEIVSRIKETTTLKPRNSTIPFKWSAVVEEECLRFFCPLNIRKFVALYWISWYPHWPVIHKPTFVASAAPCTLLAAMVLIGASYSPDIADRDKVRIWFNAVEEMVFSDEYVCDDPEMITGSQTQLTTIPRRRLQALQAAHAICLCQAYEGDEASKRRARHHRCNAVVAVSSDWKQL